MFKRKIAFFYINDPNWIGGMDYVVNAVNSLSFLDDKDWNLSLYPLENANYKLMLLFF